MTLYNVAFIAFSTTTGIVVTTVGLEMLCIINSYSPRYNFDPRAFMWLMKKKF